MAIHWHLTPDQLAALTGKRGEPSAYELAKRAGISQTAAMPVLLGAPVGKRLDVALLEAVAAAFGVDPLTLLEYRR